MKIFGINGSPRKKSNTRFLLREALDECQKAGAETKLFNAMEILEDQEVPFCEHCSSPCNRSCYTGKKLEQVFEELKEADGIILSSPVYFGSVSAQLKAIWDMSRAVRTEHTLVGKVGAAISVGASTYGGQETTIRALHDMLLVQGMTVVGNGVKGIDVGHQGAAGKEKVFEDKRAIEDARNTGKRVVNTICCDK